MVKAQKSGSPTATRRWWILGSVAAVVIVIVAAVTLLMMSDSGESNAASNGAGTKMLIIGDSYTFGFRADNPETDSWAAVTADHLDQYGWQTNIDGIVGSGYINTGVDPGQLTQRYSERIARATDNTSFVPNVLVLQGGLNDYASPLPDLTTAVEAAIDQARAAWPGVQVVIFTSSTPQPLAQQTGDLEAAVVKAAVAKGAPTIQPFSEKWMTTEDAPAYTAADGNHLTTAGYNYVAQRFLADFAKIGGPPYQA